MAINIDDLAEVCCDLNSRMLYCKKNGEMLLEDFIELQADKVRANKEVKALENPEDFFTRVEEFAGERMSSQDVEAIVKAVRYGAVCTADHHGGLFCSQTFQANLLFGEILKNLGSSCAGIPIMPGGQVELGSSTYARGLCMYTSKDKKNLLPIFPEKPSVMACFANSISDELMGRFRHRYIELGKDEKTVQVLDEIFSGVYETEEVRNSQRFEDQVSRIGVSLFKGMFREGAPTVLYMEMEELLTPLLIRELSEGKSLLSYLLTDENAVRVLNSVPMEDGSLLSQVLFRAVDEKGRKIVLNFTESFTLEGKDWRGNEVTFQADAENLIELLNERRIYPGIFLLAVISFFERGITWFGGAFQSLYLPKWQKCFCEVLKELGLQKEEETIKKYYTDGYVCGPMYALYHGDCFSSPAGPVEIWMEKPSMSELIRVMRSTTLWDSHLIGLTEMYFDLVGKKDRVDGWYRIITEELGNRFPENVVVNG